MANTKHPRNVVHEQFAPDCTIDGSRLDRAMETILRRWNRIEGRDIQTRWMQTQFVQGWSPEDPAQTPNFNHKWPWMTVLNDSGVVASGSADDDITNPRRSRGYRYESLHWTTTFWFEDPVILRNIYSVLLVDSSTGSGAKVYQATTHDFKLAIEVPSEFDREDASMASTVFFDELTRSEIVHGEGATYNDMSPTYIYDSDLAGWVIDQDLCIPIPQRSRVKLTMSIGNADNDIYGSQKNVTLTVLEPVHA